MVTGLKEPWPSIKPIGKESKENRQKGRIPTGIVLYEARQEQKGRWAETTKDAQEVTDDEDDNSFDWHTSSVDWHPTGKNDTFAGAYDMRVPCVLPLSQKGKQDGEDEDSAGWHLGPIDQQVADTDNTFACAHNKRAPCATSPLRKRKQGIVTRLFSKITAN